MTPDIHRFAAFELDRHGRALRLNGREVPLQPRVFDLLMYLVDNRDRVVSKEELFDNLWPGVIVTESSLQRAVSLARTALQKGGLGEAIRSYARRGYRFSLPEQPSTAESVAPEDAPTADAERCFAQARWTAAMEAYAEADRASPLDAESLERWGTAAQCAGDLASAVLPLERAAVAYSSRGEHEAAARVTIALARIQLESLDVAVAQGCLRRAERLLSGSPRGEQHGHLAWMTARLHLYNGDLPAAIRHAMEAGDIGQALQNADIEAMGLLCWGIALQASGETSRGLELQDEAAAAVLAGDISPLIGGIVYCGMIASCCNCGDWPRAGQWNDSFTRWCRRSNIDTFAGACVVHRAEVFATSGKLEQARDAIARGDAIIRTGAPWALGDAYRLMGDLHLARGEDDAAECSYQHAYQNGWDPHPGYAILLHQRGRSEEAIRELKRAAAIANWAAAERKARYLAHAAQIAALSGQLDEARSLLETLDQTPRRWESGAIAGQVELARAELNWATGQGEEAIGLFRLAVDILKRHGAVMDAALTRMRLAETLAIGGEQGAFEMELLAAEAVFEAAGAIGYLAKCRALRSAVMAQSRE
jgi:DNA-binding winged helix-turn-helix (wHTH) protein